MFTRSTRSYAQRTPPLRDGARAMSLDHAHSPAVGTKQRADGASHHPPVRRRGVRLPAGRFWRVQLRATEDRTPPIGPEEVRPAIRRLVISDLHLGAGDA